jgi:hypothetical protein
MVVLMSVMAFLVPKFSAVWTLPILADTITAGAVGADMADSLLLIMNVTIPFRCTPRLIILVFGCMRCLLC